MATSATRISVKDYFRLHTKPECELIGGELRPKPMGTRDSMDLEFRLRLILTRFEKAGVGEAKHEL